MRSRLELSPRLAMAASMVPDGARLADVGTDHAYLPAWLLQHGVIQYAIASDLREGPLERARQTARRFGLTECISFRLCDGLSGIAPEEADTISIAGMGGETIAAILSAAPWSAQGERRWLLQPMSGVEDLRVWLSENGFSIRRERLSQEGRTLYVTLLACPGADAPLTPGERWAGRQTREDFDPLRGQYLERLLSRAQRALEGARSSRKDQDQARTREFEAIHQDLTRLKEEWDAWQR